MPIRKIQFMPTEFYHVFNRGNGKQNIFYNDKDRYRFLQAIYLSNNVNTFLGIEELERGKGGYALADIKNILETNTIPHDPLVRICADCLMSNHYHFLIQEIKEGGISKFMQRLGTSYAKYFVTKYERPGSLFQGRFKATHIENDDQLKYLLAYVNAINPAQLAEPSLKERGIKNLKKVLDRVNNYKWSTHFEFMGKRESILIDKGLLGEIYPNPKIYYKFIEDVLHGKEKKMWAVIEKSTLE
ncbi:MAG: transposase [Candidatus Staskawiczbacteria bacterium]|nr:transposase [Candidatus Staskawiczbacteria bacterium]